MSAPKSRVKQQKIARKRQRKADARKRHRTGRDFGMARIEDFGPAIGFQMPNRVKMSGILEDFVMPYDEGITVIEHYRVLLTFGQVAWNAALHAEPQRSQ